MLKILQKFARGTPSSLGAMEGSVLEETFDSLIESLAHHGPVLARVKVNYPTACTLVTLCLLESASVNVFKGKFVVLTMLAWHRDGLSFLHWTSSSTVRHTLPAAVGFTLRRRAAQRPLLYVASTVRHTGCGLKGGNTHYYQVQGQQWIQRKQPRTQGYSLGHGSVQSAWQGIISFGENYRG